MIKPRTNIAIVGIPNDVTAPLKFAEDQNVDFGMLDSAVKKNTLIRIKN